jgi:membrane protein insertase Oxa1/YidC/SpoIIIJ
MWTKTDKWGVKYWPAIPGGILVLIGALAFADKYLSNNLLEAVVKYGWPVIIIAVGLRILIWPPKGSKGEDGGMRNRGNGNS